MPSLDQTVRTYQELASWHEKEGQAQMRDRFLVLAADTLLSAGKKEEADRLRHRLLQLNPHHLLKPYPSLIEALKSADVQNYVEGLRRSYPPETAADLLESLRTGKGAKPLTAPVEAKHPGPEPLAKTADGPQVYRLQDGKDEPRTVPGPGRQGARDLSRPAAMPSAGRNPAAPPSKIVGTSRPVAPSPLWPETGSSSAWRHGLADQEGGDRPAGAWLPLMLFWLLLLAATVLAVYSLGRPFLIMG